MSSEAPPIEKLTGPRSPNGCNCNLKRFLVFKSLIALPFAFLYFYSKPSAEDFVKFYNFVFVEVMNELFFKNTWALPVIYLMGVYIPLRKLFLIISSVAGLVNAARFYIYYFGAQLVPGFAGYEPYFPVCKTTCDIIADLKVNNMTTLWVEDAVYLACVAIIFILVDGIRYRFSFFAILFSIIGTLVLGPDTVLPLFLVALTTAERTVINKRSFGDWKILYYSICLVSVCKWFVPLLQWAVERGTIAGQFEDGLVTIAGTRGTMTVMICFFQLGWYFIPDVTAGGQGVLGHVFTWFLRLGALYLCMAHMAGAISCLLLYREWTANKTYVATPVDEATKPKAE